MNVAAAPSSTQLNEAIDRYHDVLTAYVDKGGEDHLALLDRMVQRGAVFAGRPICTFLRPQFLLRSQQEMMDRVIGQFRSAVNSLRAKILDKKMLFALLYEPRIMALYTREEEATIRRHVPWTRRVAEGHTTDPDGATIDLLPWLAQNRESLVLKPNDEVGGRGVLIGANVEPSVWERQLKLAVLDPSIVQRRVVLPSAMFPEVGAAGELFFSRRHIEHDPYLFRGETRGVLTRLSATSDCSLGHAGAGTVPTFILEDPPSAG